MCMYMNVYICMYIYECIKMYMNVYECMCIFFVDVYYLSPMMISNLH